MDWKDNFPQENRYFETENGILYNSNVLNMLKQLPDESIDCVITSPPYWAKRDYGIDNQIGLEPTFQEYLEKLWEIFDEVYRILKPAGTVWINLGDTYNTKCLLLIPERFAIGMIDRGWILRNTIIWHKPNAMPESVKDRFTVDFEYIYFFVKQKKYYFEQQFEPFAEATLQRIQYAFNENKGDIQGRVKSSGQKRFAKNVLEGKIDGRNKRAVWSITTKPFKEAHFAVFPPDIPETCIKAGCPDDGIVMDIFMGSGTTAVVAERLGRKWVGIEINPEYCEIAKRRIIETVKQRRLI